LRPLAGEDVEYVTEAVRILVGELGQTPLIGFAGAPFTLASYLIEGRPSRSFERVKAFMYTEPKAFESLLGKLAATMARYLEAQVRAGVHTVQLFDSWVGALAVEDYETRVLHHTRSIFDALARVDVPRIHFGTNTAGLLEWIAKTGPDIVSLDWRVPLDVGWRRVGDGMGVQGNLDPAVLLGPPELVRDRTGDVLRRANGRAGHVFNLGHGVLPETPVENLQLLVETVHAWVPANVA
jgi:uroporphyrinogen decarboxylase